MSQERARRLIREAYLTNEVRGAQDHRMGFAAPEDGPADMTVRTIMEAVYAGLVTEDWAIIAEGYVMLGDLHRMMTGVGYTPERAAP